jgi:hypothetical protein
MATKKPTHAAKAPAKKAAPKRTIPGWMQAPDAAPIDGNTPPPKPRKAPPNTPPAKGRPTPKKPSTKARAAATRKSPRSH